MIEKLGRFGGRKAQVGGTQLGQVVLGTEAGQRERWIRTGSDHQVQLGWQVFKQKGEGMVNPFGINHVVIVEDKDERVRNGGDVIEQGGHNRFGWRWLRGLEQTHHPCAKRGRNRLHRGDQIR